MKKPKLQLNRETIRVLDQTMLRAAAGGGLQPIPEGFIMQDTVIVPTGFIMKDTIIVKTSTR